jgi:hypothetical protein
MGEIVAETEPTTGCPSLDVDDGRRLTSCRPKDDQDERFLYRIGCGSEGDRPCDSLQPQQLAAAEQ